MPSLGIIILAGLTVALMLVLVQIYLSWRPSLVWGLFLPAVFLLFLLFFALAPAALTSGFVLNEAGKNTFVALCEIGFLTSALILAFTRIGKERWQQRRERERQERIEAKRQRLAAEKACLEEGMSVSRSAELAEQEKMAQARRLALAESERELLALEQKRQAGQAAADAVENTGAAPEAEALLASSLPDEANRAATTDVQPAADAAHLNRLYPPETEAQALPRQIGAAVARFGGSARQYGGYAAKTVVTAARLYGRAVGQALAAVCRRAATSTTQAAGDFWSAAKPRLAETGRRAGAMLAAGKSRLTAWAGRTKDQAAAAANEANPAAEMKQEAALASGAESSPTAPGGSAAAAMEAEREIPNDDMEITNDEPDTDTNADTDTTSA